MNDPIKPDEQAPDQPDDQPDATNRGVSAPQPAEGADDVPDGDAGTPERD